MIAINVSRDRLVEQLGIDAAARVVSAFGGKRLYVPAPETEAYARIVSRLGDEIARKLCVEFGGTQICLPQRLVPMNEQILKLDWNYSGRLRLRSVSTVPKVTSTTC